MDLRLKILYKNKKAEEQFNPKTWSVNHYCRRYPELVKNKIIRAEGFIRCSNSLYDIAMERSFRLEKLKGDRKDEWSIRLGNTGYRVTFIPCDDNGDPLVKGDVLAYCKTIKIVMITEVSNHYE